MGALLGKANNSFIKYIYCYIVSEVDLKKRIVDSILYNSIRPIDPLNKYKKKTTQYIK